MKPNILIINPDQMRADSMRHLGNPAAYTPNLDALAQEGVSFSNAFCQNPVCVPSRCSFMTGLYPHVHGHRTMGFLQQPHEENLFGDMKQAGYFTAASMRDDLMAGQYPKYHKKLIDKYLPVARPKRRAFPYNPDRGTPDSDTYYSFLHGIMPTDSPDEIRTDVDDLIIDGASKAIRRRPKNKPFFMFVGLMHPHPPYEIEQKYYDLIDKTKLPPRISTIKDSDGKPLMERGLREALRVGDWDEELLNEIRAIYLAMCAKTDDQLGRLLQTLRDEGIYDNTAILFFSDHGDYTADFGLVEKSQNCFPDCVTKVPFVIKPPKGVSVVEPGVHSQLVELVDVCATVADMADVEIKRSHFSRSLLPAMADKGAKHRDFVCCEGGRLPGETHCMEYNPATHNPKNPYAPRLEQQAREDGAHTKAVMLRTAHYKYVRRLQEQDEFYDLEQGESVNLIDNPAYSGEIDKMKQQMLNWMISTCDVVPWKQDSRHSLAFIKGGLSTLKLPAFLGDFVGLWLRITKQGPSEFLDALERRFMK